MSPAADHRQGATAGTPVTGDVEERDEPGSARTGAPGPGGTGTAPAGDTDTGFEAAGSAAAAEAAGSAAAAGAGAGAGDEVEQLRRERDEYLDALRRLQADFENYRKRVQRQQDESVARAAERLVAALLPALDAFDLAAAHLVGDEQVSPGGLLQAAALLRDALAKEGLERVGEVGDPFDPNAHEAVDHTADDGGEGPVVDAVLRVGYRFNGRTIRPAMVKVRG